MNEYYYKLYSNIEKPLIDYILNKYWNVEGYSAENVLNNPRHIQAEFNSLGYASYKLERAFEHLFNTFKREFKRLF